MTDNSYTYSRAAVVPEMCAFQLRTHWLYDAGQLCVVSQVVSDILRWYAKPQHVNTNSGGDRKADPYEPWTLFSFDDD